MSDPEIQGIMGKALYSQIIPMIWRMGGTPSVYVMDALQDCNAVLSTDEVKSDVAAQTKACVNGKAYYLVNAVGAEAIYIKDPFYGAMIRGMQWPFTMPSGVDKLDGTQWGGLTVAQIIQGSQPRMVVALLCLRMIKSPTTFFMSTSFQYPVR